MMHSDFIKVLQTKDKDKLREWLVKYGKPPKPVAAVLFITKEVNKDN